MKTPLCTQIQFIHLDIPQRLQILKLSMSLKNLPTIREGIVFLSCAKEMKANRIPDEFNLTTLTMDRPCIKKLVQ